MAFAPQASSDLRRRKSSSDQQRRPSMNARSSGRNSSNGVGVQRRASSSLLSPVRKAPRERDEHESDDGGEDENQYDERDSLNEQDPDTFSGPLHYVSHITLSAIDMPASTNENAE